MATLNFIMPRELQEGFCDREAKQNKVKHAWVPIWADPSYLWRPDSDRVLL